MTEPTQALVPVADPRTGELVDIGDTATDHLCDLTLEIKRREHELTVMRYAVEDELVRRMGEMGRAQATVGAERGPFGTYNIAITRTRSRVWDAEELEGVLTDLVNSGALTAGEMSELIRTERTVDGKVAQRLLGQLTGSTRDRIADCFHWVPRGRERPTIERIQPQHQLAP